MSKKLITALLLLLAATPLLAQVAAPQKANDGKAIEAGMRFTASVPVIGARFYKPVLNAWTISIYDSSGNLLDTALSMPTTAGWCSVDFPRQYPAGAYTISYYSTGDYTYTLNYFNADSIWSGYKAARSAGVFKYGRGRPTQTFKNTNYEIWPVVNPVSFVNTTDTTLISALVVVVNPDGSPVRLPDGTSAAKLLLGYDPPGPVLEQFLRYVNGVMYRYTIRPCGTTREKRVNKVWIIAPY